jgi:outer membrane protein assembly factor BamD
MFSQAYYKTEQYYLVISLKVLLQDILKVKKVQEAAYLGPKSYSMLSPIYSLDQTDTYKAIDKLQAFIDTYPNSEYLSEATVRVLQEK